jgi:hypothetical protein
MRTEEQKAKHREYSKKNYYKTREKKLLKMKEYQQRNRERLLAYKAERKDIIKCKQWRITEEEYQNMLIEQDNKCYICGREERRVDTRTGKITALCIDHDHSTGNIRKLLCCGCNRLVGNVEMREGFAERMKDQEKAEALLAYIAEHIRFIEI